MLITIHNMYNTLKYTIAICYKPYRLNFSQSAQTRAFYPVACSVLVAPSTVGPKCQPYCLKTHLSWKAIVDDNTCSRTRQVIEKWRKRRRRRKRVYYGDPLSLGLNKTDPDASVNAEFSTSPGCKLPAESPRLRPDNIS